MMCMLYNLQVWFKNKRAKCRQIQKQKEQQAGGGTNTNNSNTNSSKGSATVTSIKSETKTSTTTTTTSPSHSTVKVKSSPPPSEPSTSPPVNNLYHNNNNIQQQPLKTTTVTSGGLDTSGGSSYTSSSSGTGGHLWNTDNVSPPSAMLDGYSRSMYHHQPSSYGGGYGLGYGTQQQHTGYYGSSIDYYPQSTLSSATPVTGSLSTYSSGGGGYMTSDMTPLMTSQQMYSGGYGREASPNTGVDCTDPGNSHWTKMNSL